MGRLQETRQKHYLTETGKYDITSQASSWGDWNTATSTEAVCTAALRQALNSSEMWLLP